MKKIISLSATILLLGGVMGYVTQQTDDIKLNNRENPSQSSSSVLFDDVNWQSTLKQIAAYYVEPPKPKVLTEAEKQALREKNQKPAPKPVAIEDARLIGVVLGNSAEALLILPKANDTARFKVGESWLPSWRLTEIKSDSIVWQNTESGEKKTQKLFK